MFGYADDVIVPLEKVKGEGKRKKNVWGKDEEEEWVGERKEEEEYVWGEERGRGMCGVRREEEECLG